MSKRVEKLDFYFGVCDLCKLINKGMQSWESFYRRSLMFFCFR